MYDFEDKDIHGNVVICKNDTVYLELANKKKARIIGHFQDSGNFVKNNLVAAKHKFRMNDGWGVNWIVVDKMKEDDCILFYTDVGNFFISKYEILKESSVLKFSKQGYELQHIIPQKIMSELD